MARRLLGMVLASAFCAVFEQAGSGSAQQPPALAITSVEPALYPRITAVLTALDANGAPVTGLTAASFRAFEGNEPLQVEGLTTERLGLSVSVVIDVSGSMQGAPMAAAKAAASEFVRNLAPTDSASVYAFSSTVRQVTPFTSDIAQLDTAINGLQAAGDTSLFEAAQTAVFAVSAAPSPRKAVVLLSDGADTSSAVSREGSLNAARDAQIPVHSIAFGDQPDASYLQALSQATSGQYRVADAGSVSAVYGDIARLLNSQYTLTLVAPGAGMPAGPSTLRVATDIGGQPAEATFPFERPGSIAPTPAAVVQPIANDDPSETPLLVYGGVVGSIVAGLAAVFAAMTFQRSRIRRRQLAVVAPNLQSAAANPLPQAAGVIVNPEDGFGRLFALDDAGAVAFEFTSIPLRIGSGLDCDVRLPAAPDVAPRHASIWMRDGKIMLRHLGGVRRPTLVAGRPIDWVILEHGDEFTVGAHRYRAEVR